MRCPPRCRTGSGHPGCTLSCFPPSRYKSLRAVILAKLPWQFLIRHPVQGPGRLPWSRISAGVVYRNFVVKCIQIRPSKTFNQLELVRMRQAPIGEPEVLIEAARIGNQGVAFPFSDSPPVIQGVIVVTAHLPLMAAAVEVDDPV